MNNNFYTGYDELVITEKFLKNNNRFIVTNILNKIQLKKNHKILDFGAGIGTLSDIIYQFTKIRPICAEIDQKNKTILRRKKFKVIDNIAYSKTNFDLVFSSNVLEHIEDDIEILKNIRAKLNTNGILYLYLPAMQILYSDFDRSIGHFRRYNKKELISKVQKSGLKVQLCEYSDSIGFFASLLVKFIGYNKNKDFIMDKNKLTFYDKFLFKLSLILDKVFKNFFGKNIYIVAEK